MSDRIKVGDVYFELPKGVLPPPIRVVAEKPEEPAMLDPVAFMSTEPDLVTRYIARPVAAESVERVEPLPEAELDRMAEWQAFAGVKSPHPQQWLKYAEGKQKLCGFNSWAFFIGLQWFVLNKMYGLGIVAAFFEIAVGVFAIDSAAALQRASEFPLAFIVLVAGLSGPRIVMAYVANIALYRRAVREIKKIRVFKLDNQRKLAMLASAGSPSFLSLALLYALFFGARFIATHS